MCVPFMNRLAAYHMARPHFLNLFSVKSFLAVRAAGSPFFANSSISSRVFFISSPGNSALIDPLHSLAIIFSASVVSRSSAFFAASLIPGAAMSPTASINSCSSLVFPLAIAFRIAASTVDSINPSGSTRFVELFLA